MKSLKNYLRPAGVLVALAALLVLTVPQFTRHARASSPEGPFQATTTITLAGATTTSSAETTKTVTIFTVPPDRRAEIQFASASAPGNADPELLKIHTSVGAVPADHFLLVSEQGSGFVASQQTEIFADAGTDVKVTYIRMFDRTAASVIVTISGKLRETD